MPTRQKAQTDEARTQNRFVISLPKELGDKLDRAGAMMSKTIADAHGFAPEFSRAQVIQGLVDGKLTERDTVTGSGEPATGVEGDSGEPKSSNGAAQPEG